MASEPSVLHQAVWLQMTANINWKSLTPLDPFFGDGEAIIYPAVIECPFGTITVTEQFCMQGKKTKQTKKPHIFIVYIITHVPCCHGDAHSSAVTHFHLRNFTGSVICPSVNWLTLLNRINTACKWPIIYARLHNPTVLKTKTNVTKITVPTDTFSLFVFWELCNKPHLCSF